MVGNLMVGNLKRCRRVRVAVAQTLSLAERGWAGFLTNFLRADGERLLPGIKQRCYY